MRKRGQASRKSGDRLIEKKEKRKHNSAENKVIMAFREMMGSFPTVPRGKMGLGIKAFHTEDWR